MKTLANWQIAHKKVSGCVGRWVRGSLAHPFASSFTCILAITFSLCLSIVGSSVASSFLQQPGLRARGMGGAFSAVADDGSAGLWNPAGLGQLSQTEVTAIAGRLAIGLDTDQLAYGFLSYVEPLTIGTVGLAGSQFASDLYKESELVLSFSEGLGSLYLGASLKGLFATVTENEYTAIDPLFQKYGMSRNQWSIDLGALWRASDSVSVAFTASDINQPSSTFASDADLSLPVTLRTGIYLWDSISFDLNYRTREISGDPDWSYHVGGEWWLGERLAVRAGVNRDELAAGTSVAIPYGANALRLDYALQYPMPFGDHMEDTWGSHLLAISVRFGEPSRGIPRDWGSTEKPADATSMSQTREAQLPQDESDAQIREKIRKIRTGSADKKTYWHVVEYYQTQSRVEDAIAIYKAASDRYPEDLSFLYELGKTCERLSDSRQEEQWLDQAVQAYQEILSHDETYEDVKLRIVKIRIQQGKGSEVMERLDLR